MTVIEIENFRAKYPDYEDMDDVSLAQKLALKYPDSYSDLPDKVKSEKKPSSSKDSLLKPLAKETMEMGGLTAGAITGAKAGALIGTPFGGPPGALAGAAIGGVIGGGLGYAIGKRGGEIITGTAPGELRESLTESGKDIVTGAAYEAGGQLAGKFLFQPVMKAGKWTFDQAKSLFQNRVTNRITSKAYDVWVANTSQGNIYAKNAKEAADIETAIPGIKFTYGQSTYDPKGIRMERAQIRKPGDAAQISAEQIASNDEALRSYYKSNFGSKDGVDDLLGALQGKKETLEKSVEGAKQTSSIIESRMAQAKEPTESSTRLLEVLKTEKQHTSQAISRLYDRIPDVDIPTTGMIDELKTIAIPTSKVESSSNFPKVLNKAINEYSPKKMPEELQSIVDAYSKTGQPLPAQLQTEVAKYGTMDSMKFQELRGLRTEILNEMRSEASKNNPAAMRRLSQMQEVVEGTIDQLADSGKYGKEVVDIYRMASKQWREYSDIFKRGTVGNIMQGGVKGEVSKMDPEQMLSAVFDSNNVTAADQLITAIGRKEATSLVKEYATYDLMRKSVNPMTGEVDRGKLMSWLAKNKPALTKYGLENEYSDIVKAKAAVDEATKIGMAFEKSQAAKALGGDPEKAISIIFSGRGATNSAQTAKDIMELVKGNKAATEGVKNAFGDYAVARIQTSMKDIVGNPAASVAKFNALWQKYAPAMRVLYQDSPQKIQSLMNMKKAYEIMIRNQRSPFGGGSDTAENVMQTLAILGSPLAQTSRTATAIKAAARMFSKHEAALVDQVINKAIFNPEYAETLQWLAKGYRVSIAEKRFSNHIASLGIMEADKY